MSILNTLHDRHGRVIVSCPDGRLAVGDDVRLGDASGCRTVIVAGDPADTSVALLVSAHALTLFPDATPQLLWGLVLHDDGTSASIRLGQDGPFLAWDGETLFGSADNMAGAARVQLRAIDLGPGEALWCLPPKGSYNVEGLSHMFGSGEVSLVPVIEALLPAIEVSTIRDAWAKTPPIPRRDLFHAMVKAETARRLGSTFLSTTEHLRTMIDAYDWSIGDNTYGRPTILEPGRGMLRIGRFCSMADPTIILGNHATHTATTYPFVDLWKLWPGAMIGMQDHLSGDVVIGNDVWIGVGATILPGSVIGDGAVIGAGSIVRGALPPYAICAGNPARVKRYRFDEPTIERLLCLRWWDWPEARIDRYLPLMFKKDITSFLDTAEAENNRQDHRNVA